MKYPLDIQLFADGKGTEETPLTFDEILADKEYQAEFDKRVAKAIKKVEERLQPQIDSLTVERDTIKTDYEKTQGELNVFQNVKVLSDLGVDEQFIEFVGHAVSKLDGDDFQEKAKTYIEANPQYKAGEATVVKTSTTLDDDTPAVTGNEELNKNIRKALGR